MSDLNRDHIDPVHPAAPDDSAPEAPVAAEGSVPVSEPEMTQSGGLTAERLGDMAIKFATETAYAAAGVADLVARSTREFIDQQRQQLAERTPEGVDPNFKQFVDQMPDQFKAFLDDVTHTYHDMAARGRGAVADFQAQIQTSEGEPSEPGEFDDPGGTPMADARTGSGQDDEPVVVVEEIVDEVAEAQDERHNG
ncbi:MAG: hypothetical protein ACK5LN_05765 [Propioniciclava sp.]